jgi:hypothetical protein
MRKLLLTAVFPVLVACSTETPKPAPAPAEPPAAAPAAPAPAAPTGGAGGAGGAGAEGGEKKSKLAPAPTDGLSLAERIERRKADEAKVAAQLAADERERLLKYDKTKLALHTKVYAAIKKARAELEKAKTKEAIEKVRAKQEKTIVATGKLLQKIDPKGGNSNVVTDYDVMLNALANDYPEAMEAELDGDKTAATEQRAELDKRAKKIEDWLKAVKAGK